MVPTTKTKIRWGFYAVVCGFIAFTLLDDNDAGGGTDPRVVQPTAPRTNSAGMSNRDVGTNRAPDLNLGALADRLGQKGMNDLFAGPRVEAPPPRVQAPRFVPPVQPSAPPNPFTYLGMWSEGGKTRIFLANGNSHYVVQPGDVIDQVYELESFDWQSISVIHRPTGTRQLIQIIANTSGGESSGAHVGRQGDYENDGEELN